MTTPVGVGVGGGEYSHTVTPQSITEAVQQANLRFKELCRILPSYSNDKTAFYKARDEMFDLMRATDHVAATVAAQTGQAPPTKAPAVPTASSAAAASAGVNPQKGTAIATASPAPASGAQGVQQVKSAVTALKQVAKRPVPKRRVKATPAPSS